MSFTCNIFGHLVYAPKSMPPNPNYPGEEMVIGQVFVRDDHNKTISVESILKMPKAIAPGFYNFTVQVRSKYTNGVPTGRNTFWYLTAEKIERQGQAS